ncbi:hypothetical protein E4U42_004561, partial [Claviceps africana]
MSRRRNRRNHDFQIHIDPCSASEPPHDLLHAMDREDVVAVATEEDADAHLAVDARDLQPSVETVEDEAENEVENEEGLGSSSGFAAESCSDGARDSFGGEAGADRSHVSDDHEAEPHLTDSSSHHEHDDDVFSENSPRTSTGSASESDKQIKASPELRPTRVSDIPQSDQDDDFVPTIRGTPRPPFRSPSSVQALQMESPWASGIESPRSSRRTSRPSLSRLGSPNVSALYPPKKTPPRFKRNTPPLVLLHVTLMPSRWSWGHVLDTAHPRELSPEAKTLWDSWRLLQDRTGDTVSARGILLPHPQNDYEVLEERLLEALELPLKRRARILECGHYLGPSNEMAGAAAADDDDDDDEEEEEQEQEEQEEEYDDDHDDAGSDQDDNGHVQKKRPRRSLADATHWCTTCHSDIRYDSLGTGKVFRVKVYASNGLMRAGAWQACWKEMERVDVELEPVLDAHLQEELVQLAAEQERIQTMQEEAAADAAAAAVDEEIRRREAAEELAEADEADDVDAPPEPEMTTEPAPAPASCSEFDDDVDGDLTPDEARLREIYGHGPRPSHEQRRSGSTAGPADYFGQEAPPSPPSPSVPSPRAFGSSEERHPEPRGPVHDGASLPELLLEAIRVFLQDQKNVMIVLLSLLVLMLAVGSRPSQGQPSLSENMVVPDAKAAASVKTQRASL